MIKSRRQFGFSLVEMLIYAALLSLIVLALVNIMFSFSRSYEELGALRAAEHSGLFSMERLVRDVHSATSIDAAQSVFNTSPGALAVIIGTSTSRFSLTDGVLRVSVDGVDSGPLSSESGQITQLVFRRVTTEESEGVKIEMTVRGTAGRAVRDKTYQTTVILKNS